MSLLPDKAEKPNDLCPVLCGTIENWLEDRTLYWDMRTDVPIAGFWREKADEFATAMMKSVVSLQANEELRDVVPVDFWQEWLEQYDVEAARRYHMEKLQPRLRQIREDIQRCQDPEKRKMLQAMLEFGDGISTKYAQEGLLEPPDEDRPILRLVWECIGADVAKEFAESLEGVATRMLRLWGLLANESPSDRCLAYMRRVSRCYVWGFEAECIIMCRSVLEAAFEAQVPTDDCSAILGPRRSQDDGSAYTLCDRICVAVTKGYIDLETGNRAHGVRKAGRDVVHKRPAAPGGIEGTYGIIRDTLRVVEGLCAMERPKEDGA